MSDDPLIKLAKNIEKFQKIIGYSFASITHLFRALLTTSYHNDSKPGDKSFHDAYSTLGDSILHVICMEKALEKGENTKEGLTIYKMRYASNLQLHDIGLSFNLQDYVVWGKAELHPPVWKRSNKILANYLEALFGAVYLDGGMDAAKQVVKKLKILK